MHVAGASLLSYKIPVILQNPGFLCIRANVCARFFFWATAGSGKRHKRRGEATASPPPSSKKCEAKCKNSLRAEGGRFCPLHATSNGSLDASARPVSRRHCVRVCADVLLHYFYFSYTVKLKMLAMGNCSLIFFALCTVAKKMHFLGIDFQPCRKSWVGMGWWVVPGYPYLQFTCTQGVHRALRPFFEQYLLASLFSRAVWSFQWIQGGIASTCGLRSEKQRAREEVGRGGGYTIGGRKTFCVYRLALAAAFFFLRLVLGGIVSGLSRQFAWGRR